MNKVGIKYQTVDVGMLYRLSESVRVGAMIKNVFDIADSRYTRPPDISESGSDFTLPTCLTFGISKTTAEWTLSLDNEFIFGEYGGSGNDADFWLIRAGLEKRFRGRYCFRCGLIVPAIARTSSLGNLRDDIPWPKIGGSAGFGAAFGRFIFDFALFGDPARSYIEQEVKLKAAASLSMNF